MSLPKKFIVIDDDDVNNLMCRILIRKVIHAPDFIAFLSAKEGFSYISNHYQDCKKPTILFLDINMPEWNGWEFLENFDRLADDIKTRFKIYMLSSSEDQKDMEKANENKNIEAYIVKPLSKKIIQEISGISDHS